MSREPLTEIFPVCEELGIGFVPYSPLSRAYLAGTLTERTKFIPGNDNRPALPRYTPEAIKANWSISDVLTEFGMENSKNNFSRRSFLKSSALAGGGLMISFSWLSALSLDDKVKDLLPAEQWNELNGYIKITPDNIIKILNPNPEFGQNVMTSLPMIVAEELEADWEKIVVEMGPHDNLKLGPQFTGGSNSVRMYWKPLREAGAAARHMLMEAAAQTWAVPVETTKKRRRPGDCF